MFNENVIFGKIFESDNSFIHFIAMFEDLVSSLLSKYLGEFVKGLERENLKISLFSGKVHLNNLVFNFITDSVLWIDHFPYRKFGQPF